MYRPGRRRARALLDDAADNRGEGAPGRDLPARARNTTTSASALIGRRRRAAVAGCLRRCCGEHARRSSRSRSVAAAAPSGGSLVGIARAADPVIAAAATSPAIRSTPTSTAASALVRPATATTSAGRQRWRPRSRACRACRRSSTSVTTSTTAAATRRSSQLLRPAPGVASSRSPTLGRQPRVPHAAARHATGCDSTNTGAAGYFQYFGAAAGKPGQGYYSFDVGTWHLSP